MPDRIKIVVLDGDETVQELLEQAIRVLDPELLGVPIELEHFDLSLEHRRQTSNQVVIDAAAAMREAGLGLKAATITPEGAGDASRRPIWAVTPAPPSSRAPWSSGSGPRSRSGPRSGRRPDRRARGLRPAGERRGRDSVRRPP